MDDSMYNKDRLSIKRIAGASIIDSPPLFSHDGETLFIISANTARAYSTYTSEWIRDLEETSDPTIVNIQNVSNNPTVLYGCTTHGSIVSWQYLLGTIDTVVKINFPENEVTVKTFTIITYKDKATQKDKHCALLTWTCIGGFNVQIGTFDLTTGSRTDFTLPQLAQGEHKVSVSRNKQNTTVAVIQSCKLFVKNYQNGRSKDWKNAGNVNFTAVACHPVEETVAVGDAQGRIFVYHNLYSRNTPTNTLHHWHPNSVNTITFTSSGSVMYSGGYERVIVGWDQKDKKFRPRLKGNIFHISVSLDNQKIAVSTDDNAITIFDPQFDEISSLQTFVRMSVVKTPWPKLSLGLKVDPRTNYLVLNGRMGEVQFYSPQDERFFNLDTTMENRLSFEREHILYDTRVTHAACNADWLVTAESLDDLEHFPDVRIKFWKFEAEKNNYVLNTQIESPHEGAVTALEFSSSFAVDNLLCASSGLDRKVKVWSLVERDVIDRGSPLVDMTTKNVTRMSWIFLEATSYKNLAVDSLAFSQDGASLAVGFGNTLCIYTSETLRIKSILSTPCGQDGSTNKLIFNLPKSSEGSTDRRQRVVQMVKAFLENDDDKLLTEIIEKTEKLSSQQMESDRTKEVPVCKLKIAEKEIIFNGIMEQNELNFYQKLELFQKLGIQICLPANVRAKFFAYIADNMSTAIKENALKKRVNGLGAQKFIGQWKLQNYLARRSDAAANGLHLKNVIFGSEGKIVNHRKVDPAEPMEIDNFVANPIRKVSQIKRVLFATEDCGHFVIVCTEKRLLIWNLLTTRLHATFKLSVKQIAVDPCTSLVAVYTSFQELYILHPSKLYVLYRRKQMPKLEGMVWLPRRHPKQQSLDVDWQACSQLFLLNREQELFYMIADNDEDLLTSRSAALNIASQLQPQTHFGAMHAKQITNDTIAQSGMRTYSGGLIGEPGKNCIKSLIIQQTHTMAPVKSMCYDSLKSFLSNQITKTSKVQDEQNDISVYEIEDSEDEEDNNAMNNAVTERKEWSLRESMVSRPSGNEVEKTNRRLTEMLKEKVNLKLF